MILWQWLHPLYCMTDVNCLSMPLFTDCPCGWNDGWIARPGWNKPIDEQTSSWRDESKNGLFPPDFWHNWLRSILISEQLCKTPHIGYRPHLSKFGSIVVSKGAGENDKIPVLEGLHVGDWIIGRKSIEASWFCSACSKYCGAMPCRKLSWVLTWCSLLILRHAQ